MGLAHTTIGAADRPWLVWIHGFLGSSVDFAPFAQHMVPNFRSLLVDLPAHGGSVDVAAVSVEQAADAVAATMRSVGIASATVVGYSLGARIALSVAARHRALLCDLIIESGSPGIVGTEQRARRRAADDLHAARLSISEPNEFLKFWYGQPVFRSLRRDQELLARLANSRQIPDRTRMATALRAFSPGQQEPNWHVLPGLPGRLLYLAGDLDGKFTAIGRRVSNVARQTTFAVVPKSGHIIHFESPDAYFGTLRTFLSKQ